MEVVEEINPCGFQQKKNEDLVTPDSAEVDCNSRETGCATTLTVSSVENNGELIDTRQKSPRPNTDITIDQSNKIPANNYANAKVFEGTSGMTVDKKFEETVYEDNLENCNIDQKLDVRVFCDYDKTTTRKDIQSSKQEGIDQDEVNSKVESTFCNVTVGDEVPCESDKLKEEHGTKMGDCESKTPEIDDTADKDFCDMSDLAYVTNIVVESQTSSTKLKKKVEGTTPVASLDAFLEKASKQLGRRLVAMEYDSSGTEDSSASTTGFSSSSTESSSSTSSSSSSSSSSDTSDEEELSNLKSMLDCDEGEGVHYQPPKTKDEILPQELPVEEEVLWDGLPEDAKLEPVGDIQSFVELMLVIKAFKDTVALDADTTFFKKDRRPFGKVYDVFGPVQSPFYVIRFCNEESFKNTGLNIGDTVYYAPDFLHVTKFVFVEQLKKMKGSDASWQHDQEPPPECLDYSDDEEEARAKSAARKKRHSDINYVMDDSANDADGEGDGSVRGKIRRGKKANLKGRGHYAVKNSFEDKHLVQGTTNTRNSSGVTGGTGLNAPSPNQPIGHQERLPFTHPMTDLSATRFNSHFGQPRLFDSGICTSNRTPLQRPLFTPTDPQGMRARACQQSFGGNFNGNVKEHRRTSTDATTEGMSTCEQEMAPSLQQRGLNDGKVPVRGQNSSFRPGYTFPPPPPRPPLWPVFDPSVPPPTLPTGIPSRPPAGLPPRFPSDFPPPNIRNPPIPPINVPPPNWRPTL